MEDLFSKALGLFARNANGPWNSAPVPYVGTKNQMGLFNRDDGSLPIGDRAYQAHGSVGTLFAIVNQLSDGVATAEWHLYRRTSVRDKKKRQEVLGHGFQTIWDMPNPFYTGRFFRESCQQHMDLVGETTIVMNTIGNLVIEMWPVRPDRMKPVKHPKEFLVGWVYCGPDGEEVPLELDRVLQIKYPNPSDPYRGMGPVQTMLMEAETAKYAAEWNRNFFINGAQPGGVVTIDYRMTDKEFEEWNRRWQSQHQGVANAHRVALLERAKWQDTKFSMTDMQFVELRNLPRELIREAFAFPKPMLGTVDDVNRANSDAAKEIMAEQHINPRLNRWKDAVNAFLLPRFANGKTLELDYDNPAPVNYEAEDRQRNSLWNAANKGVLSGFHPDDVTEALGLPAMRWVGLPASKSVSESTSTTEEPESDA
jgi:HK97 family phage portal protein